MQKIIHTIIERELGQMSFTKERLSGDENIVFRIDMPEGRRVLRLNQNYLHVYQKETWAMQQAEKAGVAVPKVDAIGHQDGYDYMLVEYLEGQTCDTYVGDKTSVYEQLGQVAARINSVAVKGYGRDFVAGENPHFSKTWQEHIKDQNAYIFEKNIVKNAQVMTVAQYERAQHLLKEVELWEGKACLSHNDLSLGNIIIDQSDKMYLIDWSRASGLISPLTDIGEFYGRIEKPKYFQAFLHGYAIDKYQFEAMQDKVIVTSLGYALRALRWAVEDCPNLVEKMKNRVHNFALKHLNG